MIPIGGWSRIRRAAAAAVLAACATATAAPPAPEVDRLLARLDDRQKAEIEEIDRALGKIARGEYGRCETCGQPISWSRLEALPTAVTCLPCAEAREQTPS